MHADVRKIINSNLTIEQINRLDGAPILDPEFLDDAIVSTENNAAGDAVAVYSYNKLVELFSENWFSSHEDPCACAEEWIDVNVMRLLPYLGDRQPVVQE